MKSNSPVALVTGSARRMGAAIARTLHENQYNVVIHYRHSETEALSLKEELNAIRKNSAVSVPLDFAKEGSVSALIDAAIQAWGRLDVLVNNASSYFPTGVGETTEEQWRVLMGSNLKAPYFLSQAAVPHLRLNKGCIVNITDIHAIRPSKGYPVYSVAKAGLAALTRVLALELGPEIRVNAVAPGTTIWPEGINALSEEAKKTSIDQTILKRKPTPKDICAAVMFLIHQPCLTGQVINVDAGKLLRC